MCKRHEMDKGKRSEVEPKDNGVQQCRVVTSVNLKRRTGEVHAKDTRSTREVHEKYIGKKKKGIEVHREKKKDIEVHLGKKKDRRSTREVHAKYIEVQPFSVVTSVNLKRRTDEVHAKYTRSTREEHEKNNGKKKKDIEVHREKKKDSEEQ